MASEPLTFPGRIEYRLKPPGEFGVLAKDAYAASDKKVCRHAEYLGRAANKAENIFCSRARGLFSFSNAAGFAKADTPEDYLEFSKTSPSLNFHFGDIWMIGSIYEKTGLGKIPESLIPECGGTFKALAAFRVSEPYESCSCAAEWRRTSCAGHLYPQARLETRQISEFHRLLGREENFI